MTHPHDIPQHENDPSMKVSSIEPSKKDPNLREIRVNGRLMATLPTRDIASLGLTTGALWVDYAERVEQAATCNKVRTEAYRMLGRRSLSQADLHDRLVKRGYEQEIVRAIVDELSRDGWIDERALADSILHELTRQEPAGRVRIEQKLRAKKIDEQIITEMSDATANQTDPVEQAVALARKRMRSMEGLPPSTIARRLAGILSRRGFDEDTVISVLTQLGLASDVQHD